MIEEYLDVVDEKNEVIGQESRRVVHQSGLWHRGSHVFLFTPEGKLVIQQRSESKVLFPGALDCSVSEHLNIGEGYYEGARRGLREELGVEGIALKPLLLFKMNYGPNDNMISELYEGVCPKESLRMNADEIEEIAYYTMTELQEMMRAGEVSFAPWFIQLLRWYTTKVAEMQIISTYP